MKKALKVLILLFGIMSCNAQIQSENEEQLRSEINVEFNQNASKCHNQVDAVSNFNDKKEFWNICNLKNGNRIITIESHEKKIYYQEIYFEKNGVLVYAKETENYMPKNHFTQMSWNCEFYTKKGELITIMSLGHGKTEDEDWNPNIIFKMYKDRLSQLKRIKK